MWLWNDEIGILCNIIFKHFCYQIMVELFIILWYINDYLELLIVINIIWVNSYGKCIDPIRGFVISHILK